MNSNILSRLIPQSTAPSIYDTLRQAAEDSEESDLEERAGLASNSLPGTVQADNNVTSRPPAPLRSDDTTRSGDGSADGLHAKTSYPSNQAFESPDWRREGSGLPDEEANDDVPLSLLVEDASSNTSPVQATRLPPRPSEEPEYEPFTQHPSPGDQTEWGHADNGKSRHRRSYAGLLKTTARVNPLLLANEREKAMWRWTNVTDLDSFLHQVYDYYTGKGIYSILLARVIELLTVAFVVGFGLFLTTCVDYSAIPVSEKMEEILIPKCTQRMSTFKYLAVCVCSFIWFWQFALVLTDFRRLWHMKNFYTYLLDIPDSDMQTVSWQQVVARLMLLRDQNANTANDNYRMRRFLGTQSKQRMDAHDIANRLMRRENYMIALINKDILDLRVRIPYFGEYFVYSRSVEWYIKFAILDFVFDHKNQVNPMFLSSSKRALLSEGLQRRFRMSAFVHLATAPFSIVYMTLHFFFRYFQEYQKNPGRLGARSYTPLAEWKFREFNELYHMLERRLKMSYNIANIYLNQWPKDKMIQAARFVGLIAGALASVLVLATLWDPDLFLGFEITPDRTVLFYTGVLAAVWTAARNVEHDETDTALPDEAMEVVCEFTHYKPAHWQNKLHSDDVRKEFSGFYQVKLVIFLEEILSVVLFPFILYFNLPSCSNRIVDFFREFTVHVDGLGYICSFALFDFQNKQDAAPKAKLNNYAPGGIVGRQDPRQEYYATKDNKMMSSYMHFMDAYHHDPGGRKTMAQLNNFHSSYRNRQGLQAPNLPGASITASTSGPGRATRAERDLRSPTLERQIMLGTISGGNAARSQRPSRPAPFNTEAAPSPQISMLLDATHQPSETTGRARLGMPNQLRKGRFVRSSTRETIGEEEERGGRSGKQEPSLDSASGAYGGFTDASQNRSGSATFEDDDDDSHSQLGGSWKTTHAAVTAEDDYYSGGRNSNEGGQGDQTDDARAEHRHQRHELDRAREEGGMLGLIAQFSRAAGAGGGAGGGGGGGGVGGGGIIGRM